MKTLLVTGCSGFIGSNFVRYFLEKCPNIRRATRFAAETHIDNSIKNRGVFVQTNVNGTFTPIDLAYKYEIENHSSPKRVTKGAVFHHISILENQSLMPPTLPTAILRPERYDST